MEEPDPLIRLQNTIKGKFQEKLRGIHPYKGLPEKERLRIARRFLDPLFADLSGRTKNSFVRHIKNLLKGPAAQELIKQTLETLSALEAAIKPHVKNVKIAVSLWDILSAARTQLTEHAFQHGTPADIPEQKMTEKALKASEERYRALVEGVNEFIMVIQDGKVAYANPKMLHDASMSMDEFAQKPFFDFIYKEDLPVVMDYYRKRLEGDLAPHNYSMRIVDTMGKIRWMQTSSIPISWDDRPAVLVLMTDISRLKHVEEVLQRSEQKMREVSSNIPGVVYQFYARDNGDIGLYYISGQSMKLFGISPEPDGFFERFTELVLPEYKESFLASNDNAIRTISEWQFEGKLQKPSGEIMWFRGNSIPHRQEKETIFNGVLLDITEQKRSEAALLESEERYRNFIANASEGIFRIDIIPPVPVDQPYEVLQEQIADRAITGEANEALSAMYGLRPEEMVGRPVRNFAPNCGAQMADLLQTEGCRVIDREEIELAADGRPVHIVESYFGVVEHGLLTKVWGVQRNIAEHKKAEEALRESEKKFRDIAQLTPQIIYEIDADYRLTFFNREAKRMLGYAQEDIHQDFDIFTLFPEEERSRVLHSFKQIIKEGSSHGTEYTMVRNDGTRIPVIAYSAPVFRNGNFAGFRGVIIDISERKKTEDDLRLNKERLEAVLRLNQMVSSDTHEITDFALEEAVRLTKSTVGYIAFLDENETTLTMYSWSVVAMGECAITDKPIIYPVHKTGLWGEAVRQRRPVITNDYHAPSPLKKGYPEGHVKLARHMNVPIFEGNRIVLLAGVGNKPAEYDESDVQQLTLLMQGMWGLISRKRADEARRESEQMYRSVIDNIQDVFYRSDKDGRLLMGSPSGAALFGYGSVEEMIGLSLDSFWVYPEDRERLIGEISKRGKVQDFEGMIKKKDGTPFYASFTTHFYYDDAGNFLGTEGIIRDITKRKQAERALQESEALFRSQFEFGNIGIAITSVEKYWLRVNKRLCEMLGYAEEELLRKTWTEMTHPDDMDLNLAQFNMMLQGEIDAYEMDKRFFRKDGGIVYVHIAASCSRNPDRSVDFVITSIQDITERKKTEEMLQISEMRYRNIFENAVEGFFQSTPEGRFLSVNPAMAKMCGYATPEEMVESITDLGPQFYVYPEERRAFMERMEAHGVDEDFEHQVYRKGGSIIWISSNTRAVRDNSGKIIFYEGTNEDITKRKRAEAELTASELFLKQTQSIARLGGWKANPYTDYLEWTDGIYEIIEAPRDYRPGFAEGSKYFPPRYIPLIRDRVTNCLATGETFVIEAEVITDTGKELWAEVRGLAPVLEGGRSYVAGTLQDITERKQSEKKVLESEQAQRAILQASPIGICRIRDRFLEWFNEYMCRITGYGENELQGQSTRFLYADEEEFNRVGDVLYRKGLAETKWVRKDGAIRDIFLQVSRTGSNAYILTASDVTGRKQLESQLLQAQKMEAVGTLAGGVAHDFNNILSAIMGYASLLQLKIDRDSPLSSYISQILTSSERAAQLTQSLLAFSRKQQITMKPFLLNDAIANIQKLLVRLLTEDIDLKTHLTHERLVVLGDVNQIGQVVMNLVTNARDAMSMGGIISIYTSRFTMDDKFVGIHGFGKPGKYAQIMVSDTGTGIDEHVLPKIFEPFFTTKAVGKGTGLGLSLVYGIIDQHDGYIDVKSEPGKGTSFFIYLPLITQSLEAKGGQRSEAALKGTEKILIAEDNKEVRNLISMVLMENGYTVITAEDGLEAIRIFSEQAVDMVILDVIMPKMNGKETLDALKKQQPSLKVLFMSGYTYDIIEEKGIPEEGVDLILKPLKPDELLKKVRELLDS